VVIVAFGTDSPLAKKAIASDLYIHTVKPVQLCPFYVANC
jgi:hypothetical protein